MTRRTLMGLLVAGGSLLVAGVVAIPALLSGLSPALQPRRRESWRAVGPLNDFAIGEIHEGMVSVDREVWPWSYRGHAIFILRRSEAELVVFSRSCTDLGCPLDYDRGSACFFCPCHGGIFTQEGNRLAGPPNRPMYRFAHRVREGVLEVDLSSIPSGV